MRYIGLLDCNNFFVSCERLFRPDLAKRPVVVLSSNDGCIVARSSEAKALGIPMGIPLFKIRDLVVKHEVVTFSSNFDLYRDMSKRVSRTLADLVDTLEVYSIDESFFYLEATSKEAATKQALDIKDTLEQATGIPVSVGIAPTKTLAKVANHLAKQSGEVVVLTKEDILPTLAQTPIGTVWGIGRQSLPKLTTRGIKTALAYTELPHTWVRKELGLSGERIQAELTGERCFALDHAPENPKMIQVTRSFGEAQSNQISLVQALNTHISRAAEKLRSRHLAATELYLFLRTKQTETSRGQYQGEWITLPFATSDTSTLMSYTTAFVKQSFQAGLRYKKAGVTLGGLVPEMMVHDATLFTETNQAQRTALMHTLDIFNHSHPNARIEPAALKTQRGASWLPKTTLRSPQSTTNWSELPVIRI